MYISQYPRSIIRAISTHISHHKKAYGIGILIGIVVLGLYFFVYKAESTTVQYEVARVSRQTVRATVIADGQIESENTLNITPEVGGVITSLRVQVGQRVTKGQVLATIDATDAQKQVRDAKLALQSAELDLDLARVNQDNSDTSYDIAIKNAYHNLLNSTFDAYPKTSESEKYNAPQVSGNYILNREGEIIISTYSSVGGIGFSYSGLASGTGSANGVTPAPIGNTGLYVLFSGNSNKPDLSWVISIPNKRASNYQSNLNAYNTAILSKNQGSATAQTTQLNLRAKEISVQQKRNALIDAQNTLAKYTVRAPVSGIVTNVAGKQYDRTSSGSVIANIASDAVVARVALNESDVAKVVSGQKVHLTFDSLEGRELVGVVKRIDPTGTITSGVVNYGVDIAYEPTSEIKPGMSVTAEIVIAEKKDVVALPSATITTVRGKSFVSKAILRDPLVVDASDSERTSRTNQSESSLPTNTLQTNGSSRGASRSQNRTLSGEQVDTERTEVSLGVVGDSFIEITDGILEGDMIVTRTITNDAVSSQNNSRQTTPSLFGGGPGAGAIRQTSGSQRNR